MIQEGREAKDLSAFFVLNIEILDFQSLYISYSKKHCCLTFIFYLKNVNKWNFCEDFLLKSCLNVQAMYQDYVQEKIWIFRFYMIFFYLICGFYIFLDKMWKNV